MSLWHPVDFQNQYVNIDHISDSVAGVPSGGDVFQDTELPEDNVTRMQLNMIVILMYQKHSSIKIKQNIFELIHHEEKVIH